MVAIPGTKLSDPIKVSGGLKARSFARARPPNEEKKDRRGGGGKVGGPGTLRFRGVSREKSELDARRIDKPIEGTRGCRSFFTLATLIASSAKTEWRAASYRRASNCLSSLSLSLYFLAHRHPLNAAEPRPTPWRACLQLR